MTRRYSTPTPAGLFGEKNHLFVFAHQDDDLPYAGLLQRALPNGKVAWVTNGDGLAPAAGMELEEYARLRTGEARAALRILGYGADRLHFLDHSEIFFYALFIDLKKAADLGRIPRETREKALRAADAIVDALRPLVEEADVVWTLAWQGGHPEHDLTHYLTVRTVRQVEAATGRTIPIYELPAYELTVAIPLRFAPWHRGVRHRIRLTDDELRAKEAAFVAYRSQAELTALFRKLIGLYGILSAVRLRPFSFRGFARVEEFGAVPLDRDYTRSTHGLEWFDYMFEDYEGDYVSFSKSVVRYLKLIEAR
jgi:LmbE family N-acetylglucosaminyl deacetylase